MNRLRDWWNGELKVSEDPNIIYAYWDKPWLRRFYDDHKKSLTTGAGALTLLIIGKLLDKVL